MTYDESHCTWSFWKMDKPLFVELKHGYTLSIVCKFNFGVIWLTRHGMHCVNKMFKKTFIINLGGTKKCYIFVTTSNAYTINWLWPVISNSFISKASKTHHRIAIGITKQEENPKTQKYDYLIPNLVNVVIHIILRGGIKKSYISNITKL